MPAAAATKTPAAKAPKAPKAAKPAGVDANACAFPYMFVGAVPDAEEAARLAMHRAVEDADNVTLPEAQVGWAIPPESYYEAGDRPSAAAISEIAYRYHKGSARSFRQAVGEESWAMWETMGKTADGEGMQALLAKAKSAAVVRDTRHIVLQDALYFAGLAADEAGSNAVARTLRDTKTRHKAFQAFVLKGPDDVNAMRVDAARAAEARLADHQTASEVGKKRKRASDADQASAKKARRAALMMAFVDAGVDMPGNGAMTPEELTFMDDGPLKPADFLAEAETIAAKRLIAL